MENNILSAEEWLEKEELVGEWKSVFSPSLSVLMERYANYKSRMLQAKILGFRQMLQNVDTSVGGTVIISSSNDDLDGFEIKRYYDNYFKIEN